MTPCWSNSQHYVHRSADVWGFEFRTRNGTILGRAESDSSSSIIYLFTNSLFFFFLTALCRDLHILSRLTYACRELEACLCSEFLWSEVLLQLTLCCFSPWEIFSSFLLEACGQNQSARHCTVSVGDRQMWLRVRLISKNIFPGGMANELTFESANKRGPRRHPDPWKSISRRQGRCRAPAWARSACQATI